MNQSPTKPHAAQVEELHRLTRNTAADMRMTAYSLMESSELSTLEIDAMIEQVAKIVPAGNIPNLILSGLSKVNGAVPAAEHMRRDIGMLFQGVRHMRDNIVYSAFFAGPAAIIWAYQNLLRMAGKDPDAAFPEGTWQFYVEYALREDTARHTNETHGFDSALQNHKIHLSDVDRIAAWVMASVHILHSYPRLLENEWRERVYTWALLAIQDDPQHQARYANVFREWQEKYLPYYRQADARGNEDYAAYRRRKFDEYLSPVINELPTALREKWLRYVQGAKQQELLPNDPHKRYGKQLTIWSYLEPDEYNETRRSLMPTQLHIGIVYEGRYYRLPATDYQSAAPVAHEIIRSQVAAIVQNSAQGTPADLTEFAQVRRAAWPALRKRLPKDLIRDLDALRQCPILLNCDPRDPKAPLAALRSGERGIGDHALTIFDTRRTFVFDQSHIYFDGTWGAALAEIMTNEALSWASYFATLPKAHPTQMIPAPLPLRVPAAAQQVVASAPKVMREVTAENTQMELQALRKLREDFKKRNDLLNLTVNDLLVLYRAIHAITYRPSDGLLDAVKKFGRSRKKGAKETANRLLDILQTPGERSAILIPVDGSKRQPRDRVYPMTFDVPLVELDLLSLHDAVMDALQTYEKRKRGGSDFDQLQREYLGALAGFGLVMTQAKQIAVEGKSASVSTIKLLAHLPDALQRFLNGFPDRFDLLNDIIKGREVFSNVGAVAPSSSLVRFITAKDDNEKKTLAWGILTDAEGIMVITLRDFRPHVATLLDMGRESLAQQIAQEYLDSYVTGFNQYVADLHRIVRTSRVRA
jgi:hypothetical protein